MGPGSGHRRTGVRPQRPDGRPRRQPALPCLLHRSLRHTGQPAEPGPLHLPRPRRPPLLPRLGLLRRHHRRHRAHGGRPQPPRQGPARPGRGAVHPKRRLPHPLGRAQRPPPRHRHQALPPHGRRRPHPRLRGPGDGCCPRSHPHHLHRRTRLPLRGRTAPPRHLGRHQRSQPGH